MREYRITPLVTFFSGGVILIDTRIIPDPSPRLSRDRPPRRIVGTSRPIKNPLLGDTSAIVTHPRDTRRCHLKNTAVHGGNRWESATRARLSSLIFLRRSRGAREYGGGNYAPRGRIDCPRAGIDRSARVPTIAPLRRQRFSLRFGVPRTMT